MKFLCAIIYIMLAASEFTGVEVPVELPEDTPQGKLVQLQVEAVALSLRYRETNPIMIQARQQIDALLAVPDIRNEIYYTALTNGLAMLRMKRAELVKRFRAENPSVVTVDRQIGFVEKTLAERK